VGAAGENLSQAGFGILNIGVWRHGRSGTLPEPAVPFPVWLLAILEGEEVVAICARDHKREC